MQKCASFWGEFVLNLGRNVKGEKYGIAMETAQTDCGSSCCGFDPHQAPHKVRSKTRKPAKIMQNRLILAGFSFILCGFVPVVKYGNST